MIALLSIAWLVVGFGAFAAGRLRGLREAIEILAEEQDNTDFDSLPIRVAERLLEKTNRWAPWALWR